MQILVLNVAASWGSLPSPSKHHSALLCSPMLEYAGEDCTPLAVLLHRSGPAGELVLEEAEVATESHGLRY